MDKENTSQIIITVREKDGRLSFYANVELSQNDTVNKEIERLKSPIVAILENCRSNQPAIDRSTITIH